MGGSREGCSREASSHGESSKNRVKDRKRSISMGSANDRDRRRDLHKKRRSHSSSSSTASGSIGSDSEARKRKMKKVAKAKRKERKRLRKAKKKKKKQSGNEVQTSKPAEASVVEAELAGTKDPKMMQRHSMKPMSKEEWDKKQSVLRHVYDPDSGRTRLIKGDGEVMEEIVTYEQHLEINKKATEGDGATFQAKLGLQKKALFDRSKTTTSKAKKT